MRQLLIICINELLTSAAMQRTSIGFRLVFMRGIGLGFRRMNGGLSTLVGLGWQVTKWHFNGKNLGNRCCAGVLIGKLKFIKAPSIY